MPPEFYAEDDTFHEEVEGRLRFSDPKLELKCKEELHVDNVVAGTRTLLFINAAWLIAVVVGVVKASVRCNHSRRWPFGLGVTGLLSWLAFLVITTVACLENLRRPRQARYLPLVLLYYTWFLVVTLEPFVQSCEEHIGPHGCELDKPELKIPVRHRFDCSPEANTSFFSLLFLLAFSPRIMLDFRFMWFLVVWMLALAGVIIHARNDDRNNYFNPRETLAKYFILCIATVKVMFQKYYLEKSQRNVFIGDVKQRQASQKVFDVLAYMLPEHVLGPLLKNPEAVIAENVKCVSILFLMVADFQAHASSMSPRELLAFLNQHFTRIDTICCDHGVTKIETIGEEYVAAVGVVPADVRVNKEEGHHVLLGRLLRMAVAVARAEGADGVEFTMGIHTGPIVAGVIGRKLPRYRLFGDTINTAARMMQKGVVGRCQFGEDTRRHLPAGFEAESRGKLEMKGKGLVSAFLLKLPERTLNQNSANARLNAKLRYRTTLPAQRPPVVQKLLQADNRASSSKCHPDSFFAPKALAKERSNKALLPIPSTEMVSQCRSPEVPACRNDARPLIQNVVSAAEEAASASSPSRISMSRKSSAAEAAAAGLREAIDGRLSGLRGRKFTVVLEEVTIDTTFSSTEKLNGSWFYEYPPEMEKLWFQWFHVTEICATLPVHLRRQFLVFVLITIVELIVMIDAQVVWQSHRIWEKSRDLAFMCFRGVIFAVLGLWIYICRRCGRPMRCYPRLVQWSLFFSHAIIGLCIFLSYDTLTQPDEVVKCPPVNTTCKRILEERARVTADKNTLTGECWSLVFAVVYSVWMTWQHWLFAQACMVVLITTALMFLAGLEVFRRNFYFSLEAKWCFALQFCIQATIAYSTERSSRSRYKTRCALDFMDNRIQDILNTLMPHGVVEDLRKSGALSLSHYYAQMTLAQSDLVGFTKLASTCSPSRVVEIVGSLFGRFDQLTDKHGIYKVETVGDAYIAGQGGWPMTRDNSPLSVVLFALEMVEATREWASGQSLQVGCRVGVHTGECIGGVVGTEMQRYHIFGAIMSHLELLESTSPSGCVQVSRACFDAVANEMQGQDWALQAVTFEERQNAQLSTSKGETVEYHQVGGKTYLASSL